MEIGFENSNRAPLTDYQKCQTSLYMQGKLLTEFSVLPGFHSC